MKIILLLVILSSQIASAQLVTESFGSGTNAFSMDFVTIGNPGNVADTTGLPNPVGSVDYVYNLGKYEISRDMITKANAEGSLGISMYNMTSFGGNGANRPATGITWYEAASFVNWLNTSKGYQAAYNFDGSGNFQLWAAGQYEGNNQFRHKNAFYFLPSMDEWYKGAYAGPFDSWYNFATATHGGPTAVGSGTTVGTAVYKQTYPASPADVTEAGGSSMYGTVGQSGNVFEWIEGAPDGANDSLSDFRVTRGGAWVDADASNLSASNYVNSQPTSGGLYQGFRVASVPEPGSASLVILGLAAALARRRRSARGVAARR